jgi:simple sugar transport system ATP-binding protein
MKQAGPAPILSLRGVDKRYGSNGAGKSSLVKIISGAEDLTSGTMTIRGEQARFSSPHDALEHGVATIYQDLALAPRLSIPANVFMGSELTRPFVLPFLRVLDKKRMAEEARRYLARLSVVVDDMSTQVERLSGGQRQAVAISRALRWQAEIIVMDEPTASLGVKESAVVLDLIRRLKEDGRTVVLVSHNMRDVAALASRVVILEGGRKRVDRPIDGLTADDLAHLIASGAEPGTCQ